MSEELENSENKIDITEFLTNEFDGEKLKLVDKGTVVDEETLKKDDESYIYLKKGKVHISKSIEVDGSVTVTGGADMTAEKSNTINVTASGSDGKGNIPFITGEAEDIKTYKELSSTSKLSYDNSSETLTVKNVAGTASNAAKAEKLDIGGKVEADTNTNIRYVPFVKESGESETVEINSDLRYNSSTNTLYASKFYGDLTGDVNGKITVEEKGKNVYNLVGYTEGEKLAKMPATVDENGNMTVSAPATFEQGITGNVTGSVTGDVTGNSTSANILYNGSEGIIYDKLKEALNTIGVEVSSNTAEVSTEQNGVNTSVIKFSSLKEKENKEPLTGADGSLLDYEKEEKEITLYAVNGSSQNIMFSSSLFSNPAMESPIKGNKYTTESKSIAGKPAFSLRKGDILISSVTWYVYQLTKAPYNFIVVENGVKKYAVNDTLYTEEELEDLEATIEWEYVGCLNVKADIVTKIARDTSGTDLLDFEQLYRSTVIEHNLQSCEGNNMHLLFGIYNDSFSRSGYKTSVEFDVLYSNSTFGSEFHKSTYLLTMGASGFTVKTIYATQKNIFSDVVDNRLGCYSYYELSTNGDPSDKEKITDSFATLKEKKEISRVASEYNYVMLAMESAKATAIIKIKSVSSTDPQFNDNNILDYVIPASEFKFPSLTGIYFQSDKEGLCTIDQKQNMVTQEFGDSSYLKLNSSSAQTVTTPVTFSNGISGNINGNINGDINGNIFGEISQVNQVGASTNTADTVVVNGSVKGSVSGSVGSVTGAVGSVTGNVKGSVGSVTGSVGSVTGAVGSVTGAVGSVTGNVKGSVGSVTGSVGSVTGTVAKATTVGNGVYEGSTPKKAVYALSGSTLTITLTSI